MLLSSPRQTYFDLLESITEGPSFKCVKLSRRLMFFCLFAISSMVLQYLLDGWSEVVLSYAGLVSKCENTWVSVWWNGLARDPTKYHSMPGWLGSEDSCRQNREDVDQSWRECFFRWAESIYWQVLPNTNRNRNAELPLNEWTNQPTNQPTNKQTNKQTNNQTKKQSV